MVNREENQYIEFEKNLREEICNAALSLSKSGLRFAVFANTVCNTEYWNRTNNGGFSLKAGAVPSRAVRDIFENGGLYSTECATAMEIVYYKAVLEVYDAYDKGLFNKTFTSIYLMDWDIRDPLLMKVSRMEELKNGEQLQTGDRAYFSNPDHSPDLPQWQGENVIVLENNQYYGHGIGLADKSRIINSLNSKRRANSTQSAFLMNSAGRPDFHKLANVMYSENSIRVWRELSPAVPLSRSEAGFGYKHVEGGRLFV
jgi:protein-glutamine gamma-glutamyltransferase